MSEVWRYRLNGRSTHALPVRPDRVSDLAVCGQQSPRAAGLYDRTDSHRIPAAANRWLGDVDDEERAKAAALPRCGRCVRLLAQSNGGTA